jgi:hypothetical protein
MAIHMSQYIKVISLTISRIGALKRLKEVDFYRSPYVTKTTQSKIYNMYCKAKKDLKYLEINIERQSPLML